MDFPNIGQVSVWEMKEAARQLPDPNRHAKSGVGQYLEVAVMEPMSVRYDRCNCFAETCRMRTVRFELRRNKKFDHKTGEFFFDYYWYPVN